MNDNKNIFSKKILIIIGVTALIFIVEIIAVFYLSGYLNGIISKIKQKNQLLFMAKTERLSASSLQNDFQKVEKAFPVLESVFPSENNLYNILRQIEAIGEQTGNKVSIQISNSTPVLDETSQASYLSFSAAAEGNYSTIRNFLKELNAVLFFIKIDSIVISGEPSVNNISRINLSGKIFIK